MWIHEMIYFSGGTNKLAQMIIESLKIETNEQIVKWEIENIIKELLPFLDNLIISFNAKVPPLQDLIA